MTRRTTAIGLWAIAAFFVGIRYLSAAIILGGNASGWSAESFEGALGAIGPILSAFALGAFLLGLIYLIWAEVAYTRRKAYDSH